MMSFGWGKNPYPYPPASRPSVALSSGFHCALECQRVFYLFTFILLILLLTFIAGPVKYVNAIGLPVLVISLVVSRLFAHLISYFDARL